MRSTPLVVLPVFALASLAAPALVAQTAPSPAGSAPARASVAAPPAPPPSVAPGTDNDIVWTKAGALFRGTIVELVPNDHVVLRLATGETRRLAWAEIDHLGSAAAPQAPIAVPISTPTRSSTAPRLPETDRGASPRALNQGPEDGGEAATAGTSTPTSTPTATSTATSTPTATSTAAPTRTTVHLWSDRPETWLETRPRQELVPWKRVCLAPCDVAVDLSGLELRAAGDRVTPSNPIRVEGRGGTLRLATSAGSASARSLGLTAFFVGMPVALVGTAAFGLAKTTDVDRHDALATTGIVTMIVGGLVALASVPLLAAGTTAVRNEEGKVVGSASELPAF